MRHKVVMAMEAEDGEMGLYRLKLLSSSGQPFEGVDSDVIRLLQRAVSFLLQEEINQHGGQKQSDRSREG